jgi:competence protein ComEC
MPSHLDASREAEKDYLFMKNLSTRVYNFKKNEIPAGKDRHIVANLFVGDWIKPNGPQGSMGNAEVFVKFHGGEGYVPSDSFGDERLLEAYFIDVEQGDSILIETPESKRILIDGGPDTEAASFLNWKYNLEEHWKDFDAVIISHGDNDHARGFFHIFNDKHVVVKSVYHSGIVERSSGPAFGKSKVVNGENVLYELVDDLTDLEGDLDKIDKDYRLWIEQLIFAKANAEAEGVSFKCERVEHLSDPVVIGDEYPVTINFVNPINLGDKDKPLLRKWSSKATTVNANSVGVLLEYGKARFLFCGDMNKSGERLFIEAWKDKSTQAHVFKANHHGSHEFSNDFLKRVQPWISVISSGDNPDYGHPRACLLGSLGKFSSPLIDQPLIFSTELAAAFSEIKKPPDAEEQPIYEKTIQGVIHVRSNGNWIAAGEVYNKSKENPRSWSWEKYAIDLTYGKELTDLNE